MLENLDPVEMINIKVTRFMDLVLTARGVITDHTVGLSKPVNLLAPIALFIVYLFS